jgi:acyl dehydratase
MHYNDITIGEEVARLEFTDISAKDMQIVSALMTDPNPIHYDERAVERMGHPGLINQGPINMGYATQAALAVADSPIDIKSMQFRFEDNVYEGEDVSAIAIATDKYTENSVGYVDLEIRLENSKEKIPVTGSATVRMNTE